MTTSFLDHIGIVEDYRIPGMVTYPLSEILLGTLVGLLCGAEDWEEIELICQEQLSWLQKFLPFEEGIPQAQTFRKVFRLLDPKALEKAFASWVSSLQRTFVGVIAVDGKTARGSKHSADGEGALHVVSAYAHEAGIVIGQRAVDTKSNEITAIPDLLDCLALEGAIVTIDAMGCQKAIASKIRDCNADYILALKGNQGTLQDDVLAYFNDPVLKKASSGVTAIDAGHGRIEERICRVAKADWLQELHEGWRDMNTLVQIESRRTDKKTGAISVETRCYISSLSPDPENLMLGVRLHWGVENCLHWQLDVTFREDENRTRKDNAALNLVVMRHTAFNILKREPSKMALKRKRLKAAINQDFRARLLAC